MTITGHASHEWLCINWTNWTKKLYLKQLPHQTSPIDYRFFKQFVYFLLKDFFVNIKAAAQNVFKEFVGSRILQLHSTWINRMFLAKKNSISPSLLTRSLSPIDYHFFKQLANSLLKVDLRQQSSSSKKCLRRMQPFWYSRILFYRNQ